jgi:hypothetical protein
VEKRPRRLGPVARSASRQFQSKVDINIFTPGSKAGIPVSILSSLEAPPFEIMDDAELLGERIESTVSSLLSLVGVDADPIQSPEAVLFPTSSSKEWAAGRDITLETLIRHIQKPAVRQGRRDRSGEFPAGEIPPDRSR